MRAFLLVVLAAAACDTRATASNAADTPPERLSKELESCGKSDDCGAGLRCFAQVCQREARSVLGDYLAARAARATPVDAAAEDYARAVTAYEDAKLAVPPDLDCAYGRALTRAKGKKDKAELAARILHRCVLATPAGSPQRAEALAALTELDPVGLDPGQIAKPALADAYLTRAPSRPSTDNLSITVTAEPPPAGKTFGLAIERLQAADLRGALIACWEKHAAEAGTLVARLPLKVTYRESEYEDEPGLYKTAMDPPVGADAATTCVHGVAAPALTAVKGLRDRIETTLVVTIK